MAKCQGIKVIVKDNSFYCQILSPHTGLLPEVFE